MDIKSHDWFATLMYQPNISLEQLKDLNITPQTSSFKSREEYKNIPAVLSNESFLDDDGNFSEKKFNSFYDSALLLYNTFSNAEAISTIGSSKVYDPFAWYAVGKPKRNTDPEAFINPNPNRYSFGIEELDKITGGNFSMREIAQDQYYYDSETGEFSDKKPNDFVGIFKSFTAPNLAIATYDEDTPEIINGKEIVHKKGEYKLNSYGAPYYRTLLPGEEIYDKDLLHAMDIWSVDGQGWNKYDFFDADGIKTEPWKVVAKNLVRIAPFLFPAIGGAFGIAGAATVGHLFAGISAAASLLEFMPTFLKGIDGITTGDSLDDDFGKKMNTLETWLGRFDQSVSDRSREKFLTFENIGKMFGDVTKQLYEQKTVGSIPLLFKNNPTLRMSAGVGRALSYAYMSTISSEEAYGIFKRAGASDRTAGFAMLGLMGAYYKLMSADYFKDVLFKGSWLDSTDAKRKAWVVLQDFKKLSEGKPLSELGSAVATKNTPALAKEEYKWFERAWTKVLGTIPVEGKGFALGALSEGVEETMEEVSIDAIKGLTAAMEALGIPVTENGESLDFGFGIEDVTTRYLTSFLGGAFGGAVFHGLNLMDADYRKSLSAAKDLSNTYDGRLSELVYLAMEGKLKEARKYAKKWHDKSLLGSDTLSGTAFDTVTGVNGLEEAALSAEKTMSQNDFVYNQFIKELDFIEAVLKDEGFVTVQDKFQDMFKLDKLQAGITLFEQLGVKDAIYNDLTNIGTQILKIRASIQTLADELRPKDENYDKAEFEKSLKDNSSYKSYLEQLKELRKTRDEIYKAENLSRYVTDAVVARYKQIVKPLVGYDSLNDYVETVYHKKFNEFTPAQQEALKIEYEHYNMGDNKSLRAVSDIYRVLSEQLTQDLLKLDSKLGALKLDEKSGNITYGNLYIQQLIAKSQLESRLKALKEKSSEERTSTDVEEISKILKQLADIDKQIQAIRKNPITVFDPKEENVTQEEYDFDTRANQLLELYKGYEGQIKYGDGELNEFYSWVRNYQSQFNLSLPLEIWVDDNSPMYPDPNGFFAPESEMRKDLEVLLQLLYNKIGVDNDAAINTYNSIIDLLKNRAKLTDKQIEELLSQELPTGVYEKDEDGNNTGNQLVISLIPQFNGESIFDFIQKIDSSRQKIQYSDLSDLLKRFAITTGDSELISIMDLIMDEGKKVVSNLTGYRIGDATIKNKLDKARMFIEAVYATVAGAAGGANKAINVYRIDEGKAPLAEISERSGQLIIKELDLLFNKLNFIEDLHKINSGQKLREQRDTGVNMKVKFLQKFHSDIYKEDLLREFSKGEEKLDIDKIIERVTSEGFDFDKINADNFKVYEKEIIAIEAGIFERVHELGFSDIEIVEKLVKIFGPKTAWKQNSTNLTSNKDEVITDYDMVLYGATIMSLHAGAFAYKVADIVQKLHSIGNFDIVPVFGQQHALRLVYAFAHNKPLFNYLLNQIRSTYKGKGEYEINRIIYNNIAAVFGGAGTGKTQGVGYFLAMLFDNSEFRFVGPRKTQVSNLLKVFGRSEKTEEGKTFAELFDLISPGLLAQDNIEENEKLGRPVAKNMAISNVDLFGETTKFKVLLVDEIARLNAIQLEALTKYAAKFNIFVVGLGDPNQIPGVVHFLEKDRVQTRKSGFEDGVSVRSSRLKASFRANNRAKNDNYEKLEALSEAVNAKINELDDTPDETELDKYVEKTPTSLSYQIYPDHIAGDFITNGDKYFKSLLDRLIENGDTDILLVVDKETSGRYQDPKYDKITKMDSESAQGGEFKYVFVDIAVPTSKYDALHTLYTYSQRGTTASIILDEKSRYDAELGITSTPRSDADLPYDTSEEDKKEFMEWQLSCWDGLVAPENYEELLKLPTSTAPIAVVEEAEIKKKADPEPEDEPVAEPVPEPEEKESETIPEEVPKKPSPEPETKPDEVIVSEQNEQEPVKSVSLEQFKPTVEGVQQTPSTKIKFVPKDTVPEKQNNDVATFDKSEEIAETAKDGKILDSDDFHDYLYDSNFRSREEMIQNSLFNLLKTRGVYLDEIQYRNLVRHFHKKAMNNQLDKWERGLNKLGLDDNALQVLASIFGDENIKLSFWNINDGETSKLVIKISHSLDKSIDYDIPIGFTKGFSTGRFVGTNIFVRYARPQFKKGDWITIAELKEKFPWLDIPKTGGIIVNSAQLQGNPNYAQSTKDFAELNDGKGLGFATDDFDYDEQELLRERDMPDGTKWLHHYPEEVRTFAMQWKVPPKKIIAYATAVYFLYSKGHTVYPNNDMKNLLRELGIVTNNTVNIHNAVLEWLSNNTNIRWDQKALITKEKGSAYYEALSKNVLQSPLLSGIQFDRIITDLFIETLRNNTSSILNFNNLWYEFAKADYTVTNSETREKYNESRRRAISLTAMDQKYLIKLIDSGNNTLNTLALYRMTSDGNLETSPISTISNVNISTFKNALLSLVEEFVNQFDGMTLDHFNSSNVIVNIMEERTSDGELLGHFNLKSESGLFTLFGNSIITSGNYLTALNPDKFKYGIYGSIIKSKSAIGTEMAPFEIKPDMVTDASQWTGSKYLIIGDFVPDTGGQEQTNNIVILKEILNERLSLLNNLKQRLPNFEKLVKALKDKVNSADNLNDDVLDELFNEFLVNINQELLNTSLSLRVPQYIFLNGELIESELSVEKAKDTVFRNILNKNHSLNENSVNSDPVSIGPGMYIIKNNTIDLETNNVVQTRTFVIFSDTYDNLYSTETHDETYALWRSIFRIDPNNRLSSYVTDYLNALIKSKPGETVDKKIITAYSNYIRQSDSGTDENLININKDSIKKAVNIYLEARLKNNEC